MLKAIETSYKGYRFRSRLEARWAVYFDKLGLKWTYEHEGFELGDGSRYLPDFYFPDLKEYVEIKADHVALGRVPKIYMAGKMGHAFRRGAGRQEGDVDWALNTPVYARPDRQFVRIGSIAAEYAGPFAFDVQTKCHVSAHGSEAGCEGDDLRESVVSHCLQGIKDADAVLCFIDCNTAYGTLVELGYAAALGKPVLLFRARKDHGIYDFGDDADGDVIEDRSEVMDIGDATWFAALSAGAKVVDHWVDPRDAGGHEVDAFYDAADEWLSELKAFKSFNASPEARKAAALLAGGKSIYVFSGDPVDHTLWVPGGRGMVIRAMLKDRSAGLPAAQAARSARFEFGECGA